LLGPDRRDPAVNPARSEARKATASATSSGSPGRPTGICVACWASSCSVNSEVRMKAGATALAVTPRAAPVRARDLVRPIRPALEAE